MSVDSSLIDAAIVSKLLNDSALMAICTDGVWFDEAKQGAQKFVIVSLVDEFDEGKFGGRAYESALYLVKAVVLSSTGADAKAAAARIDAALDEQTITAAGYTCMTVHREGRVRYVEVDDVDASIRWQHRGGNFRVEMSVGS